MPADRQADWLSAGDALARMLAGVTALAAEERPLLDAAGCVLAEDVVSSVDLPPWVNSAMDGFAVRADDVRGASDAAPRVLRVVDDVPAGRFASRAVGPGEAIRVMTGAPVPDGADSVIRVEHTDGGTGLGGAEARVSVRSDADAGRNLRPRAEDVRAGEVVLPAGTEMHPGAVAVAAAVGGARLRVVRRPVVAVLTSGDELAEIEAFAEVRAGRKIVSGNTYALAALLAEAGMEARVLGIARDTPESLREHLERAAGCDALVTSAGISVGEHDYVLPVLREMATDIDFWRVRIRPGSAMAFGHVGALGGIPWFGLPGNPVSTLVTATLFVLPALLRMCGHARLHLPHVQAMLADAYSARGDLTHFPRVRLAQGADGVRVASLTGGQGSGLASSMAAADGLAIAPAGAELVAGDPVQVVVLGGAPRVAEPPF